MKIIRYLILLQLTFGCKNNIESTQVLSDDIWYDVLAMTAITSTHGSKNIFYEYDNLNMKRFMKSMYLDSVSDLNYKVNDSILLEIETRLNHRITNNLDTMFNSDFRFINDTTNFKEDYLIYSEPIYLSKDIFAISMREIAPEKNYKNQWFFLFKQKNDKIDLMEYYDWNLNMYYKQSEW